MMQTKKYGNATLFLWDNYTKTEMFYEMLFPSVSPKCNNVRQGSVPD